MIPLKVTTSLSDPCSPVLHWRRLQCVLRISWLCYLASPAVTVHSNHCSDSGVTRLFFSSTNNPRNCRLVINTWTVFIAVFTPRCSARTLILRVVTVVWRMRWIWCKPEMSPDDERLYTRRPFSVAVYREGRKQMPKCFLVAKTRTGGWQLQRFNYKKKCRK